MKHLFSFIFLISYFSFSCFAKQNKIDSLENILKTNKEDTNKVNHLNTLSWELINIGDYEKAMQYANYAVEIISSKFKVQGLKLEEIKNWKLVTNLKPQTLNFELFSSLATAYNNIGIIYWYQGNYDKALENYFTSLKIKEEIGDKQGIASSYNNIGGIYWEQGNYDKALENHFASLKIREEIRDKQGIAASYNNIGIIYDDQGSYDKALENYFASLKIKEELGDKQGIAATYNNIGIIYDTQNNYNKTLENYFASLKIREELGDKQGIAESYNNIAKVYLKQDKPDEAKKQSLISLGIAKEIRLKDDIKEAYQTLSLCDSAAGNWKGAYEYHQLYSAIKDSIFNEESSKQIHEMSTKYETEKKEQQIKLLNKDKEIQRKDLERQKTIRNAVVGGLILVLLFSFVLVNRLLLIRKQKKVIEIEREKSEKLLLNILPKETADELKINNSVRPKFYGQVTVMFTDFKGFTTIAEKMSAEELVSELDFIFKKFDEIISKYPIEKIKTIGDAYMCAGGLPVANTTNPMDVVMAALEIQEWMCLPNPSPKERGELPPLREGLGWGLRIGIHTGTVIAGVVGDKKFAYDIWGDTVNTASRMESSGEAGKVNISGTTYKMLVGTRHAVSLQFTFRGKIPAKNKGEIEMYFVERKII